MENTVVNLQVTPLQVFLSMAFQIWIVVFPILILRKLNHLVHLMSGQIQYTEQEA